MSHQSPALVYSENSDMQKEDGLKLMSSISFHDGMKVLDLGCGTGYLSSVLAERVGQTGKVVGIDPDKERIAIAIEKYGSVSNLTFQEGSTDLIPGEDFDIVFSNYVLHWIKDKKKTFENVFRCLQPTGTFAACLNMKLLPDLETFLDLLDASHRSKLMSTHYFLPPYEMEELALASGFTLQYKKEFDRAHEFKSFDEFVEYCYGSTGGLCDTRFMNTEELLKFKQKHEISGGGSFSLDLISPSFYIFKKKSCDN